MPLKAIKQMRTKVRPHDTPAGHRNAEIQQAMQYPRSQSA
jgi:hypothetical protein